MLPASAWRTDEPPQDKIVIARVAGDEFGFRYSYKHGETWYDLNSKYTVTGWMHIEDAVRILDAAKDVQ